MPMRALAMRSSVTPCSASVLPKATRRRRPLAQQLERPLGRADRAHAVVDAARAEPGLGDGEAAALLAEHVVDGHAHVVVGDLAVALVVGVAEHLQVADDGHARRVHRHEHHRLLAVRRAVGVGLAHHDRDPAVGVQRRRR